MKNYPHIYNLSMEWREYIDTIIRQSSDSENTAMRYEMTTSWKTKLMSE